MGWFGSVLAFVGFVEPITILLLGTGLMGVGGVGLVRRRRGTDLVDE